jgi:hypothetical protein
MVIRDIPKSARRGDYVFYMRRNKLCRRRYVIPRDVRTPARRRARGSFGAFAKAWSGRLTEEQRRAWMASAAKTKSRPRLGQSGPLTGEMHFEGINSARARIGREMLLWPPERVVFGPSPVQGLTLRSVNGRIRLRLRVSGPVTDDIMVLAQAPCSTGRKKWRHGAYLGLLPPPQAGESDITDLYVQKYGEPLPGRKIFIRIRQQKNGWEGRDYDLAGLTPALQRWPLARPKRMVSHEKTKRPGRDLKCLRPPRGGLLPIRPTLHRPRILRPSPSTSVSCAMHKGVVPKQCRSRSQATPVRRPRGTGRSTGIRAVGKPRRLGLRADMRSETRILGRPITS